jgi:hypothetical protein
MKERNEVLRNGVKECPRLLGYKMCGGVIVAIAKRTRPQPLKGLGQKNETEHCKKRDSPISPSDPQASTNTKRRLTPF